MRLGERLLEPIRSGYLHISWQSDDLEIVIDVEDSDRLGLLLRRVCIYRGKLESTASTIKQRALVVIDRLTYLDNSLRLIEFDEVSNVAQIRSRPDKTDRTSPKFFEIILGHEPAILLYRRSGNDTIPFYVSTECFVRLIDDLVDIARL
jgi:hypothetical protein